MLRLCMRDRSGTERLYAVTKAVWFHRGDHRRKHSESRIVDGVERRSVVFLSSEWITAYTETTLGVEALPIKTGSNGLR